MPDINKCLLSNQKRNIYDHSWVKSDRISIVASTNKKLLFTLGNRECIELSIYTTRKSHTVTFSKTILCYLREHSWLLIFKSRGTDLSWQHLLWWHFNKIYISRNWTDCHKRSHAFLEVERDCVLTENFQQSEVFKRQKNIKRPVKLQLDQNNFLWISKRYHIIRAYAFKFYQQQTCCNLSSKMFWKNKTDRHVEPNLISVSTETWKGRHCLALFKDPSHLHHHSYH